MKARIAIIITVLAALAGSCITSLFPLYTNDDIIFDERIEGEWDGGFDQIGIWTIEKKVHHPDANPFNAPEWTSPNHDSDPDKLAYRLSIRQKTKTDTVEAEFKLHLFELGEYTYFNIHPENYDLHHDFLSWHMIEAHTFMRVEIRDGQLDVRFFDPEFLIELIEKNRIRIEHRRNGFLLTAPTKDLQKFVMKYSDEEGALCDAETLTKFN